MFGHIQMRNHITAFSAIKVLVVRRILKSMQDLTQVRHFEFCSLKENIKIEFIINIVYVKLNSLTAYFF